MSRSNNLVSWIFGRQTFGRAPSDISDLTDVIMSTFEVELTLSSNIEAEIIRARMTIPDYDPMRVLAKPTIILMPITCLGHLKLEDVLKRFMDTHFADFKIRFSTIELRPYEFIDCTLIPDNRQVLSDFQSMLFHALAKEDFEFDLDQQSEWTARCPIAEKVPRGKKYGVFNMQFPLEGRVLGIRLVQLLPIHKVILTVDSRIRVDPGDISDY